MDRVHRLTHFIFVVVTGAISCRESPEAAVPEPASVVGTWRVVRHVPSARADSVSLLFGSRPRGYLVYDATGHVFLQVQDVARTDSMKRRYWGDAPDSVLKQALRGFRAYYGTYAIDSVAQMITHRIEGELLPRAGAVEVATPYRLLGDSLFLGADSLEQWHFVRVRR
jgi:hypothetical protein